MSLHVVITFLCARKFSVSGRSDGKETFPRNSRQLGANFCGAIRIRNCAPLDHNSPVKQLLPHLGRSCDAVLTSHPVGTKLKRRVKKQPIRKITNRRQESPVCCFSVVENATAADLIPLFPASPLSFAACACCDNNSDCTPGVSSFPQVPSDPLPSSA